MRTLVIHPKDKSTDYLSQIYSDKSWDVLNTSVPERWLRAEIKTHDRILMMGHGSSNGLFGYGRFVIDESTAPLLKEKDCIGIWCYANGYFTHHRLKGFFSGMIISELIEAQLYLDKFSEAQIEHSNILFAEVFRQHIKETKMLQDVLAKYTDTTNPVINFNRRNLYEV